MQNQLQVPAKCFMSLATAESTIVIVIETMAATLLHALGGHRDQAMEALLLLCDHEQGEVISHEDILPFALAIYIIDRLVH